MKQIFKIIQVQMKQRIKILINYPVMNTTKEIYASESISGKFKIAHVALYTEANAGDTLLPRTVRDVFSTHELFHWQGINAQMPVTNNTIDFINSCDKLLIGGGGLFISDSNPNFKSGWQWPCSIKQLNKIQIPIAVFAVGYNEFRYSKGESDKKFFNNLEILASKSLFIGLRNNGSIKALSNRLSQKSVQKLRFQPCPTTIIKKLYPFMFDHGKIKNRKKIIAFNCAFDRSKQRFGNNIDKILDEIAKAALILSEIYDIQYYSNLKNDELILSFFEKNKVPYKLVKLYGISPKEIVKLYSIPNLVIGMRGHSQMIPFGCGVPILSLISHDKMKWFLADINMEECGIEILEKDLRSKLILKTEMILKNELIYRDRIDIVQDKFWDITMKNVSEFINIS